MKIRFFGDSWYWCWFHEEAFVSKTLRGMLYNKVGLPILETYMNKLGIDCVEKCAPGNDFYQITEVITSSTDNEDIDYNIVFFSSLLRGKDPKEQNRLEHLNIHDYDYFMKKWDSDVIMLLENIQKWAEQYNQTVLLIGGQSTLEKRIFDKLSHKPNLHLLTECVTSSLVKRYQKLSNNYNKLKINQNFGIFKLAKDISYKADETWDPRLINHMYEDQQLWIDHVVTNGYLCKPDDYHLNSIGVLHLTDLILYKIEQLKGE